MKNNKIIAVLIIVSASAVMVFSAARLYGISQSYADDSRAYALLNASAKPRSTSALSKYVTAPATKPEASSKPAVTGQISSSFLAERSKQSQLQAEQLTDGRATAETGQAAAEPNQTSSTTDNAAPTSASPQSGIDFEALKAVNSDIAGWIEIPGTLLSYPVLQAGDNDYYLSHRYDNKESKSGAIFLDSAASRDMTDTNTFIFGHNMKNGSMFAMLHKYADPEFYTRHPDVFISLPDGRVLKYKIFSVHKASVESADYKGGVWNNDMYTEYLSQAAGHSMYDTGYKPEEGVPLIALSTCVRGESDNRFVIHAAQVN